MARAVPLLTWSGAAAGSSLTYASTAWLLSGLSASPFLNALLPALGSLPALVPLPMVRRGSCSNRRRPPCFCWRPSGPEPAVPGRR